ncbi:RNA polymerase sigma factor SigW [Tenuibacillus multivorans]|uniref:RNA polymerase sigma factor n=1 Tax=Tenuibacillus multivorans TaxID=237069 RepID=A0A1H0FEG8_9BACI|nr:RNA polymerase sigma factor SigW [Tenuibacillus multivorans]GEL77632.1 ECF RNA polymerase sigma factor SigW [Tenuibacillus multivorans]SDN93128.1 RNA polymerase sigma-70 factor, ECF subfamily [Tenuibacillus multivorans]
MDLRINQLIKQVKKGNHEAFGLIIDQYQHAIYQHCYRMLGNHHDAQEVTQEAFVKVYTNIKTFKQNNKFSPWLYRIATNLAIDHMRKKRPVSILDQPIHSNDHTTLLDKQKSKEQTPEESYERLELSETVQEALLTLPPKYRAVIVLKYVRDLPLQEIAEVLELPMGTVKTHLHRGREALRKKLVEAVRS